MRLTFLITLVLLTACAREADPEWSIAIHAGARNLAPDEYTQAEQDEIRATLAQTLHNAGKRLADGGSALDAVQAAVTELEDSPLFNAGRGAVFTAAGTHELDASIMDGDSGQAGAVAGVRDVKNPIALARLVMERTPHVMLAGPGAEAFAREHGIESTPPEYFFTERRWQQLQNALEKRRNQTRITDRNAYFGTVGAVARDRNGRLAAATSTGGMTAKRPGRIGDSPIIGAGTYATKRCAVSATGHGEFFIRHAVAHDICARSEYKGGSVARAADTVIHTVLQPIAGEGGVITIDERGRAAMVMNTTAMLRGHMSASGAPRIAITAREPVAAAGASAP